MTSSLSSRHYGRHTEPPQNGSMHSQAGGGNLQSITKAARSQLTTKRTEEPSATCPPRNTHGTSSDKAPYFDTTTPQAAKLGRSLTLEAEPTQPNRPNVISPPTQHSSPALCAERQQLDRVQGSPVNPPHDQISAAPQISDVQQSGSRLSVDRQKDFGQGRVFVNTRGIVGNFLRENQIMGSIKCPGSQVGDLRSQQKSGELGGRTNRPLPAEAFDIARSAEAMAHVKLADMGTREMNLVAERSPVVNVIGIGDFVDRLLKYNQDYRRNLQLRADDEDWKRFVTLYFAPSAKLYLEFTSIADGSVQSVELPIEMAAKTFKSKSDCGVLDERLLLEDPCEFMLQNGEIMVFCPNAIVLTTYQGSLVHVDGKLRVRFERTLKILAWEFSASQHQELFSKEQFSRTIGETHPRTACDEYGLPPSILQSMVIADCVNLMKPDIEEAVLALVKDGCNLSDIISAPSITQGIGYPQVDCLTSADECRVPADGGCAETNGGTSADGLSSRHQAHEIFVLDAHDEAAHFTNSGTNVKQNLITTLRSAERPGQLRPRSMAVLGSGTNDIISRNANAVNLSAENIDSLRRPDDTPTVIVTGDPRKRDTTSDEGQVGVVFGLDGLGNPSFGSRDYVLACEKDGDRMEQASVNSAAVNDMCRTDGPIVDDVIDCRRDTGYMSRNANVNGISISMVDTGGQLRRNCTKSPNLNIANQAPITNESLEAMVLNAIAADDGTLCMPEGVTPFQPSDDEDEASVAASEVRFCNASTRHVDDVEERAVTPELYEVDDERLINCEGSALVGPKERSKSVRRVSRAPRKRRKIADGTGTLAAVEVNDTKSDQRVGFVASSSGSGGRSKNATDDVTLARVTPGNGERSADCEDGR